MPQGQPGPLYQQILDLKNRLDKDLKQERAKCEQKDEDIEDLKTQHDQLTTDHDSLIEEYDFLKAAVLNTDRMSSYELDFKTLWARYERLEREKAGLLANIRRNAQVVRILEGQYPEATRRAFDMATL